MKIKPMRRGNWRKCKNKWIIFQVPKEQKGTNQRKTKKRKLLSKISKNRLLLRKTYKVIAQKFAKSKASLKFPSICNIETQIKIFILHNKNKFNYQMEDKKFQKDK